MLGFRPLRFIGSLLFLVIIGVLIAVFVFKQKVPYIGDFSSKISPNLKSKVASLTKEAVDKINETKKDQPYKYGEYIKVVMVLDGDTVVLENNEKLRYIGINVPAINQTGKTECFAIESANENKKLVEGKRIRIEKDVSEKDKFGRLLGYVYLEDGTFVNLELLKNGFATAAPFAPDLSKANLFKEIAQEAQKTKVGLWGKCVK